MILDAAERVLRQYGPSKTTVVDVARDLGVTHAAVYRHFASKAALREAVAERWLGRASMPLSVITDSRGPARARLKLWFDTLTGTKQASARQDPQLFSMYVSLAHESGHVIARHVAELLDQLTLLLSQGMTEGEIRVCDPATLARSLLQATSDFHNPAHALAWTDPDLEAHWEALWSLLIYGLNPPLLLPITAESAEG